MNGTLYIQKVSEQDEGKFLCEAENGVNEALGQVVSLKVNGKMAGFSLMMVALIVFSFSQLRQSSMLPTPAPSPAAPGRSWSSSARPLGMTTLGEFFGL